MDSRGGYRQSPQGLRIRHIVIRESRLRLPKITVNLGVSEYCRFDGPLLLGKTRNSDLKLVPVEGNLGCMIGRGDEDVSQSKG